MHVWDCSINLPGSVRRGVTKESNAWVVRCCLTHVVAKRKGRVRLTQALGWVSLLMPLHRVRAAGAGHAADWNGWVAEWMALWGSMVGNSFWSSLWMGLFARLAKHDTLGAVLHAQAPCSR